MTYKYDALSRRVQSAPSTGASTNFTYDGQDVAQDKTSAGIITEYLNGPGIDNKIRQKTGNTLYYFAQDHLGSTTALTDSKGALAERETYDAYGNTAGSAKTRYGYTGRERDSLTGLQYNRARFYDAQLGRFISEDPIGLGGGVNTYAYVRNNPVNLADALGLCPQNTHAKGPDPAAVRQALSDCINELWKGNVTLSGFDPSAKGHSGTADFEYSASGYARVTNNVQRFTGGDLKILSLAARGNYTLPVGQDRGLTFPRPTTFRWVDTNGFGLQEISVSPYENYTANNVDKLPGYFPGLISVIGGFQDTQIHELGNSIAAITGKNIGKLNDPTKDTDSGVQLERCVAGRLSGGH